MKKMRFLLLAILPVGLLIGLSHSKKISVLKLKEFNGPLPKKTEGTMVNSRQKADPLLSPLPQEQIGSLQRTISVSYEKKIDSSPFDQNEIKVIGQKLTTAKNHLDPVEGIQSFRTSGVDNPENFNKAKNQLATSYPSDIENHHEFIQQRVTAIYFFQYSKHLTLADCRESMNALTKQYKPSQKKSLLMNIEFDVATIARRCSHDFKDDYFASIDLAHMPEQIKNQVMAFNDNQQEKY